VPELTAPSLQYFWLRRTGKEIWQKICAALDVGDTPDESTLGREGAKYFREPILGNWSSEFDQRGSNCSLSSIAWAG
jgi:hypothetical protein